MTRNDQHPLPETGSQEVRTPEPQREEQGAKATHGDSAVGRENPASGQTDADEALGNRVGGYGAEPGEGVEPPDAE